MMGFRGVLMAGTFTAHNIRLDDGSFTKPELSYQMDDLPLLKFSKQLLRFAFPSGVAGKRIVDLGCLEGGYAVSFAREGLHTLGIDVRQTNLVNCQYVKQATNLPNLEFVCDDVSNLEKYGKFDAIFCCGILYHLEEPRKFLEQMSRTCERVLIIDTHVAAEKRNRKLRLSKITQNEGLTGRWYPELPNERVRREEKWSSWNNPRSFWPMKRDLVEALRQIGFCMVLSIPSLSLIARLPTGSLSWQ
jgi:2-polyprenyl-3-methyl-5-hydroxy-6-metoxy-1,4-benzoquinol methylase